MFVDTTVVTFTAGKGGAGAVSFRREKYIPKGGPDGGDGGNGASIILTSNTNCQSLIDFKYRNLIRAERGQNGKGSNQTGKSGKDITLQVPPGTVIKSYPDEKLIFDFTAENIFFTIVKGGKAGLGNSHFKSSTNRTPRFAQKGLPGESVKVILELKLIAFAGLVGLPNAGKSTLISKISGAKPKIADYPFTTLSPNLGVVYKDMESLVVADIPGIIEGAHLGEGMGLSFLRHIERNKVLIYLLDASPFAALPPVKTLSILQNELHHYNPILLKKKSIVLANKIDLVEPIAPTGEDQNEPTPPPLETDTPKRKKKTNTPPKPKPPKTILQLKKYCLSHDLPLIEISALKNLNLDLFITKLFELYHGK